MPLNAPKKDLHILRLIIYACASLAFMGAGAFSAGVLWGEESISTAILLFLATTIGAVGSFFFF